MEGEKQNEERNEIKEKTKKQDEEKQITRVVKDVKR